MAARITRRWTLATLATVGLVSLPSIVVAQQLPFELPALIPNEPVSIYDVPGVPDERGCVKQCFRDDAPCDPPAFKNADRRCRNINRR